MNRINTITKGKNNKVPNVMPGSITIVNNELTLLKALPKRVKALTILISVPLGPAKEPLFNF